MLGYPRAGLPALETTHPFHFKLAHAVLLGPQCNRDVQAPPRMRALPSSSPDAVSDEEEIAASKAATVAGMVDQESTNELYCSSYSSKAAPHADGRT